MARRERHPLLSGTVATSLGTLASRILGMVRDMATASLFGLAAGGVMDAFVVAFRIPNLFRRMFGEGALTASFLPVFVQSLHRDRQQAWRVAATTMIRLAGVLAVLVVLGEIVVGIWAMWWNGPQASLLAGLSAVLLPYSILVCLAAIFSAALQTLGKFATAAFAPAALNVCWLVGVIFVAPRLTDDPHWQAYILAGCVLIGGVVQWLVQWPALRREGFRFEVDFSATRNELRQIGAGMIPTAMGLAVTQLNTLLDSVLAWTMAATPGGPQSIAWLGDVTYPMQQGAAAAIYFGERLYQFPVGLLGIAVATVVFPLLSRHAARGDYTAVGDDLTRGLRLVLLLAVPASAGLVLLAEPIARLLFERGQFTAEDTHRTARMIAVYGVGVWAYCATPVLVRGFYAVNDWVTPVRVALATVAVNLALNLALIWPLAEAGLALATAIAATAQAAILTALFSRAHVAMPWRRLGVTVARMIAATTIMTLIGWLVLERIPIEPGTANALLRAFVPLSACAAIYVALIAVFGRADWRELTTHRER